MVGNLAIEPKAAEPAVCQIEVNLFAQAPLGADAKVLGSSSASITISVVSR